MFVDSKYSKVLTALLIIVIVGILGLLGYVLYSYFGKSNLNKSTKDFLDEAYSGTIDNTVANTLEGDLNVLKNVNSTAVASTQGQQQFKFKGFDSLGRIQIPKINLDLPVLDSISAKALNTSVIKQYGPGLNQVGNTVIAGHNYRNGQFFSNNYKLENGDTIYIQDNTGTKLAYTIYNKYETTPEDADYMERDTNGKPEISLTTCTDDSKSRIIIWAKLAQ